MFRVRGLLLILSIRTRVCFFLCYQTIYRHQTRNRLWMRLVNYQVLSPNDSRVRLIPDYVLPASNFQPNPELLQESEQSYQRTVNIVFHKNQFFFPGNSWFMLRAWLSHGLAWQLKKEYSPERPSDSYVFSHFHGIIPTPWEKMSLIVGFFKVVGFCLAVP